MADNVSIDFRRAEALTKRVIEMLTEDDADPIEGFFALSAAALITSRALNDKFEPVTLKEIQAAMDGIQERHKED